MDLLKRIRIYFFILSNRIRLKVDKRITVNGKVNILGKISLDIRKGGKLILGNNINIISGMFLNPLGRNIRSLIRADNGACITLGDNVGISNTCIWSKERIVIEDNVKIGADCLIMDSDMHALDYRLRKNRETDAVNAASRPILIQEDAFIGTRVIITKGVTVGARSIIAAGSVVKNSVPPDEIWGGNPAEFIKKLVNE